MVTIQALPIERIRDWLLRSVERVPRAKQPRRWIGLDLGSTAIKLIELEQTANGVRLVRQLIQELPAPQGTEAGQPVDVGGWLQSALKEFDAQEVHLAVSGPEVAVRRVLIPPMSAHERAEAVKWQVKDQIPFSVEEAVLDLRVIGEVWEKDLKKSDVLVAAASKPFIQDLIAKVERAGVRVASITPTPMALWACAGTQVPEVGQGSVVVVEFGAKATSVVIVKDGHVRVVRDLAIGSASMTEALMGVVSSERGEVTIDQQMAESFKRRYGVLGESVEGTTEEGVPLFHIASLMRPVLEQLMTELSRFLDFYNVQIEEGGVSRILLCGGGANLKSLSRYMADTLGMTVEVFNPVMRITERVQRLEAEEISEGGPRMAVAAGLSLEHGQGFNLVPPEVLRVRASQVSRRVWLKTASGSAGLALAVYLVLQGIAISLDGQVKSRQAEWAESKLIYNQTMGVAGSIRSLERTLQRAERFVEQQPLWEGIFKEVSRLVPSTILLDAIRMSGEKAPAVAASRFSVEGRVIGSDPSAHGSISQFVEEMERSVFFKEVQLTGSQMHSRQSGRTTFHIEGDLE